MSLISPGSGSEAALDVQDKGLQDFLKKFGQALVNVGVYGPQHRLSADLIGQAYRALTTHLEKYPKVVMKSSDGALMVYGKPCPITNTFLAALARQLGLLGASELSLLAGIEAAEFRDLIIIVGQATPGRARKGQNANQRLDDSGLAHVRTRQVRFQEVAEDEAVVSKSILDSIGPGDGGGQGEDSRNSAANAMTAAAPGSRAAGPPGDAAVPAAGPAATTHGDTPTSRIWDIALSPQPGDVTVPSVQGTDVAPVPGSAAATAAAAPAASQESVRPPPLPASTPAPVGASVAAGQSEGQAGPGTGAGGSPPPGDLGDGSRGRSSVGGQESLAGAEGRDTGEPGKPAAAPAGSIASAAATLISDGQLIRWLTESGEPVKPADVSLVSDIAADPQSAAELLLHAERILRERTHAGAPAANPFGHVLHRFVARFIDAAGAPGARPAAKGPRSPAARLDAIRERLLAQMQTQDAADETDYRKTVEAVFAAGRERIHVELALGEYTRKRKLLQASEKRLKRLLKTAKDAGADVDTIRARLTEDAETEPVRRAATRPDPGVQQAQFDRLVRLLATLPGVPAAPVAAQDIEAVLQRVGSELDRALADASARIDRLAAAARQAETEPPRPGSQGEADRISRADILRLVAGIAREMRQPLVVLATSLEVLQAGELGALSMPQGRLVELMARHQRHVTTLLERLSVLGQ